MKLLVCLVLIVATAAAFSCPKYEGISLPSTIPTEQCQSGTTMCIGGKNISNSGKVHYNFGCKEPHKSVEEMRQSCNTTCNTAQQGTKSHGYVCCCESDRCLPPLPGVSSAVGVSNSTVKPDAAFSCPTAIGQTTHPTSVPTKEVCLKQYHTCLAAKITESNGRASYNIQCPLPPLTDEILRKYCAHTCGGTPMIVNGNKVEVCCCETDGCMPKIPEASTTTKDLELDEDEEIAATHKTKDLELDEDEEIATTHKTKDLELDEDEEIAATHKTKDLELDEDEEIATTHKTKDLELDEDEEIAATHKTTDPPKLGEENAASYKTNILTVTSIIAIVAL